MQRLEVTTGALTGSVTIAANATTALIDLSVLDDFLIEDNETVIVTVDSIISADSDIVIGAVDSATVTIVDNDSAQVTIAATDPRKRTSRLWSVHRHTLGC